MPWWAIAALAVVTLALVTSAAMSLLRGGGEAVITAANNSESQSTFEQNYGATVRTNHSTLIEEDAQGALEAAKEAVVPVLSYDYRHLKQDRQRAAAHLTEDYREDYDRLFALIEQNAPRNQVVVQTLKPIDAGIVRVSGDRVQVLLFVDRPTTNARSSQPIPFRDYVTLTMQRVDGQWLVDQMTTQPAGQSDAQTGDGS